MSWPRTQLTHPMLVSDQLRQLCLWIDEQFSQSRGAKTVQMASIAKLWQYVFQSTGAPAVLVCCTGEKPAPDQSGTAQAKTPIVHRDFTVALLIGDGLRMRLEDESGAPPGAELLTDSVDALRDEVRKLTGLSEEFPVRYGGWEPLPPIARPSAANVFEDGALLKFGTTNFLAEVTGTAGAT